MTELLNKKCSRCSKILSIDSFSKDSGQKSGYRCSCRKCCKIWKGNWDKRIKNIKKPIFTEKDYKICPCCKQNLNINKDFYKCSISTIGIYSICKKCSSLKCKAQRDNNLEYHKNRLKKWRNKNKKHIRDYARITSRKRIKTDLAYKFITQYRSYVSSRVKYYKCSKKDKTSKLLGCSIQFLLKHLESQFKDSMTWDNYGKVWEIDHIIPCCLFKLEELKQQYECFNWKNLQPLTIEKHKIKTNIDRQNCKKIKNEKQ